MCWKPIAPTALTACLRARQTAATGLKSRNVGQCWLSVLQRIPSSTFVKLPLPVSELLFPPRVRGKRPGSTQG